MPRFRIHRDPNEPFEIESDSWMSALGEVLARLGFGDGDSADCDVLPDGDIAVTTPSGRFRLEELGAGVRVAVTGDRTGVTPRLGALPFDLPSDDPPTSPLEAPDPTATPIWATREEHHEASMAEIDRRSAALLQAETGERACAMALDLLMEFVPAESGSVLLADRRTRDLRFVATRGPRAQGLLGMPIPSGRGIAGLTFRSSVALSIREVRDDPRHYAEVDRTTGYSTHAILSVPIRNLRQTVGCLQLLNPFGGLGFAFWHQSAAQLVAARIAARIE